MTGGSFAPPAGLFRYGFHLTIIPPLRPVFQLSHYQIRKRKRYKDMTKLKQFEVRFVTSSQHSNGLRWKFAVSLNIVSSIAPILLWITATKTVNPVFLPIFILFWGSTSIRLILLRKDQGGRKSWITTFWSFRSVPSNMCITRKSKP